MMNGTLIHLKTFARLRPATLNDLDTLAAFASRHGCGIDWASSIGAGSHVLLATECQLLVGVAALSFDVEARIDWLMVAPDARRRGIGQLLVAAAVEEARRRDQVRIAIRGPEEALALSAVLHRFGFTLTPGGHWARALGASALRAAMPRSARIARRGAS